MTYTQTLKPLARRTLKKYIMSATYLYLITKLVSTIVLSTFKYYLKLLSSCKLLVPIQQPGNKWVKKYNILKFILK